MPFFERIVITESIEIKTTPEKVFNYLTSIVNDEGFKKLNSNNVSFRWTKGQPWKLGSVAHAEKYLHGKLHKFEFIITQITPNKHIEYMPTSKLMRMIFPKKEFVLENKNGHCFFNSSATVRIGWIGKTFFKKAIDEGLSNFRMYLKEEAENLKRLLET